MTLRWLYLAVLGPLVILAIVAWWGTRAQLDAAWSEARTEAENLAPQLARDIVATYEASKRVIPTYPDPPIPGPSSPQEKILASSNITALASLRDNPDAGSAASGLPLRALAAMRIETLSPGTQPRPMLYDLLTKDAPSSLTTLALRKLHARGSDIAEWLEDESIRCNSRRHPANQLRICTTRASQFAKSQISSFDLLRRTNDGLDFYSGKKALDLLDSSRNSLKTGLFTTLDSPTNKWPSDSGIPAGKLLSSVPLGKGYPLTLEIRALPNALEASIRRQQRWTFALLATALGTAVIALAIIHRTIGRERHLAEMKTQFVSSVSHELRAPLGSIRLMAEALQQERASDPHKFHSLIAREGARLSHLIENVLDFARIEDGRKRYHFEETDLSALLRDTLALMQPLAADRHVRIESQLPDEPLIASVDPGALQQALVNLLDNAIKFSPEGGSITVAAVSNRHAQANAIQLSITDQGPGIPAKDQSAIFERFTRLGNELRRETQGAGIGLSIVKHIAEAHHGSISVKSNTPNGSTFTLSLPCES